MYELLKLTRLSQFVFLIVTFFMFSVVESLGQSCDASIAPDKGKIKKVLIRLATKSKTSSEIWAEINATHAKYFIENKAEYDLCIQLDVLYRANLFDSQDLNLISLVESNEIEKLRKDSEEFLDKNAVNAENISQVIKAFDLRSDLSILDFETEIDHTSNGRLFNELYLRNKLISEQVRANNLLVEFNKSNSRFEYKVSEAYAGGDVSKSLLDSIALRENTFQTSNIQWTISPEIVFNAIELNNQYKVLVENELKSQLEAELSKELDNISIMPVDLEPICECTTADCYSICETNWESLLRKSLYLQDLYHVRKATDGDVFLNLTADGTYYGNLLTESFGENLCGVNSCEEPLSDLQGGNMFVVDEYVFIGKDYLWTNLRDDIRVDSKVTVFEQEVLKRVFPNPTGKKVVWVGTSEACQRFLTIVDIGKDFYQPIYHIDLFFHPLGRIGNDDKFFFIFGNPYLEGESNSVSSDNQEILDSAMTNTLSNLIEHLGGDSAIQCLSVPLSVQYKGGLIRKYSRYINGVSEMRSGKLHFLQSTVKSDVDDYVNDELTQNVLDFQSSLRSQLNLHGIELDIEPVDGRFDHADGLRCQVKVLDRDD